ncbi:trehalose-phosphatase [Aureimonas populi]|uniref:Trehalose 6-phosphate phosphatase n=1 Tax=Aureimonas populi TaxID=1701758 RepID=A0ABW5CGP2_9HYPH|nr:trehalose-phosphatase [Aureimonas populi]
MLDPVSIDSSRHALFLDFDGVLVDFAPEPDGVAIDPSLLDRLAVLHDRLDGALAIVSGRRIADLDRFLSPHRFAAAGVHGLESRVAQGGAIERLAGPEALEDVRTHLSTALAVGSALRLEDKGTALVLHYREHPECEGEARELMAAAVAGREGLTVMHGKSIVEVHPAGMDKGEALRRLVRLAPFAGRTPIYVGDDTTDEFAFAVMAELGGIGVKVGPGETGATRRLADIGAVKDWLMEDVDGGC